MAAPESSPAPVPTPDSTAAASLPQLLEQLAQLLQSELDMLLASHDASRIEQLAARKIELCARIEALQQREAAANPSRDPVRMQRLHELAQAVAAANQRNGAVLGALIRNTRGALDILRSIPGAETAGMYGPRGETLGTGAAKPLGRA